MPVQLDFSYIYVLQQNSALLLAAMLLLFFILFSRHHKELYLAMEQRKLPNDFYAAVLKPLTLFRLAFIRKSSLLSVLFYLVTFGISVSFLSTLSRVFPLYLAFLSFLPLAVLFIFIFYYVLWFGSQTLRRIIDVGDSRLNSLFSFIFIELIICYIGYPSNSDVTIQQTAFYLSVFNLAACYALTATTLKFILHNVLSHTSTFNHGNLWKVALLIIASFLFILTMLCHSGAVYYPHAYTYDNPTMFDLFYYIVVTFGTVGYGDISPSCTYTKLIAILTIFTSIACISIMLSSFLSISDKANKK